MPIGVGAGMALSGLAQAGGGLLGGLMSNSSSAKQASKQMDFQYYMSNTAYRRAVKDMRKAGLNPVLAAGSPASTPAGAMGQTVNLADALGKGVGSALMYKQVKANADLNEANAGRATVQKELDQDMLQMYKKNPNLREAILMGRLASESGGGLKGLVGSIFGGMNSARKAAGQKLLDVMTPLYEGQSARQYEKMNRDVRENLKNLRDRGRVIVPLDDGDYMEIIREGDGYKFDVFRPNEKLPEE